MPMSPRLLRPRQTGFNPKMISSLQLWLDASDSSTVTLNGSTVSEWRSKSGTIAVAQATAAAQPTFTSNYYNGLSALTFDGGDVLSTNAAGLSVAPASSFIVFDETTAVTVGGLFVGSPSSGSDFSSAAPHFHFSLHDPSATSLRLGNNIDAGASTELLATFNLGTSSAFGRRLLSSSVTSSTAQLRVGGVAGTADSAHTATGTTNGIVVGGRFVSGAISNSFRFIGRICEILHYSRALSSDESARIERWLARKWGATLA